MKITLIIVIIVILFTAGLTEWRENKSMPKPRTGAALLQVDSLFYLFGGKDANEFVSDVWIYDPAHENWDSTSVPDIPTARADAAVIRYDNMIYVIGGRDKKGSKREVELFSLDSREWSVAKSLRGPRSGLSAVTLNDTLLIFGGVDSEGNYIDKVEWYNSDKDRWENYRSQMIPPRANMFAYLFEQNIYFSGGFYFGPLASTSIFTSDSGWQEGVSLGIARGDGATAVQGDSLWFIGGATQDGTTDIIELYDLQNNSLYEYLRLPAPRAGHSAGIWKDTLYVFGGYRNHISDVLSSVVVYHPKITAISNGTNADQIPKTFSSITNYPNPFNGITQISITLSDEGYTSLKIYDIEGQLVATLLRQKMSQGEYTVTWNGASGTKKVASGMYLAVLRTKQYVVTKKMLYVR
jgi:N-acetylneuraminic acid mutarotase